MVKDNYNGKLEKEYDGSCQAIHIAISVLIILAVDFSVSPCLEFGTIHLNQITHHLTIYYL